jgi:hypothetical protein
MGSVPCTTYYTVSLSQMERTLLLVVLAKLFQKAVLVCVSGWLKILPTYGEGAAIMRVYGADRQR